MTVGKYTNEEDRREIISIIVRTVLGIITTFLLLCWFSGGVPFHLNGDVFLSGRFWGTVIFLIILFGAGYLLFSRAELWKILLTNFCLGIAVPICRGVFFVVLFVELWFSHFSLAIYENISDILFLGLWCIPDLVLIFAANFILYLKSSRTDNVKRSLPAAFGVYILALLAYLSSNIFFNFLGY